MSDARVTVMRKHKAECCICGEEATRRVAYLLRGTRGNPDSKAYGRDDCSWCEDAHAFACESHIREVQRNTPGGFVEASTFNLDRLPHLGVIWEKDEAESKRLTEEYNSAQIVEP